MKTKIFCDIADYKTIKLFNKKKIVDGFTTNPSLMRLAGAKSYKEYCRKLLKVCKNKPISFEVFADNFDEMYNQALKINNWGKNVYVKIPVVNSKGKFTGPIIKKLSNRGIKLNITAIYSYEQTLRVINCLNKKSKSIISIFAGRMADKGKSALSDEYHLSALCTPSSAPPTNPVNQSLLARRPPTNSELPTTNHRPSSSASSSASPSSSSSSNVASVATTSSSDRQQRRHC